MNRESRTEHHGSRWAGVALVVQPGYVALDISVAPQALHAHHAWQVMVVPGGIEVEDAGGAAVTMECAIIPPNRPHRIGAAARAWMVYIDPGHACVRWRGAQGGDARTWDATVLLRDVLHDAKRGTFDPARLLGCLVGTASAVHEPIPASAQAVREAMHVVHEHLDALPALRDVARIVGANPRTLARGFVAHAGLPFRRYVRWQRLLTALKQAARGANLTQAAHEAGFHDSAHLHHAFQQFFGVAPSLAMRDIRWPTSPADWWPPEDTDSV